MFRRCFGHLGGCLNEFCLDCLLKCSRVLGRDHLRLADSADFEGQLRQNLFRQPPTSWKHLRNICSCSLKWDIPCANTPKIEGLGSIWSYLTVFRWMSCLLKMTAAAWLTDCWRRPAGLCSAVQCSTAGRQQLHTVQCQYTVHSTDCTVMVVFSLYLQSGQAQLDMDRIPADAVHWGLGIRSRFLGHWEWSWLFSAKEWAL